MRNLICAAEELDINIYIPKPAENDETCVWDNVVNVRDGDLFGIILGVGD